MWCFQLCLSPIVISAYHGELVSKRQLQQNHRFYRRTRAVHVLLSYSLILPLLCKHSLAFTFFFQLTPCNFITCFILC